MEITVCYERKTFFGGYDIATDTTYSGTVERLKKCFQALKKDRKFTIHIDNKYSVFWSTCSDFENGILTVRSNFINWNSYDEKKIAYNIARKDIINEYAQSEAA